MANLLARAFHGLNQVRRGLATVFGHSFREPITKEYPQVVPEITTNFRGRLALTVNPETGDHLCISCRQCERVCPDKCIEITSSKSAETGKLELIDFKIDHGLCMFCGLCTEVCPTYCIINTNDFELSEYAREDLIYDLKKLTLSQDESAFYFERKEMPLPKPKPAKAAPAAGAAAAAKPAAAAPAAAKAEAPKAEAPKAEEKKEEPKAEAPKAEEKKEEPKAEAPKAEEKKEEKKEEPKADSPTAEEKKD
ncbi:MAG: NADH-quinone oxidoreductase subunit I [Candidatus Obscuribacterales bacterium]|nr:NADH-quinone oxidoreductase subunit I [Candidatus Obscuribacterales bacterium]